jgi:hypothetical protein
VLFVALKWAFPNPRSPRRRIGLRWDRTIDGEVKRGRPPFAELERRFGSSHKCVLCLVNGHNLKDEEFVIAEAVSLALHSLDFVVGPLERPG